MSAATMGYAIRRSREQLTERAALLPAMTGAFLFAAQMFNFPVAGGTSGHLLGGTLACVLLGGWTGILVTAFVLIVQCLLFQDGGVTALGANIFNMAIVGGGGGFLLYRVLARFSGNRSVRLVLLTGASMVGVLVASLLAALEIGLSGVVPVGTALTSMLLVHLPIGLAEGVATASIISALERLRPDLLSGFEQPHWSRQGIVGAVGAIAVLATLAVMFASSNPDGLEHVAETLGFSSQAFAALPAPFPDYQVHDGDPLGVRIGVAFFGLLMVSGSLALVNRLIRRSRGPF